MHLQAVVEGDWNGVGLGWAGLGVVGGEWVVGGQGVEVGEMDACVNVPLCFIQHIRWWRPWLAGFCSLCTVEY